MLADIKKSEIIEGCFVGFKVLQDLRRVAK